VDGSGDQPIIHNILWFSKPSSPMTAKAHAHEHDDDAAPISTPVPPSPPFLHVSIYASSPNPLSGPPPPLQSCPPSTLADSFDACCLVASSKMSDNILSSHYNHRYVHDHDAFVTCHAELLSIHNCILNPYYDTLQWPTMN
jgi:hypothetical protein